MCEHLKPLGYRDLQLKQIGTTISCLHQHRADSLRKQSFAATGKRGENIVCDRVKGRVGLGYLKEYSSLPFRFVTHFESSWVIRPEMVSVPLNPWRKGATHNPRSIGTHAIPLGIRGRTTSSTLPSQSWESGYVDHPHDLYLKSSGRGWAGWDFIGCGILDCQCLLGLEILEKVFLSPEGRF